MRCHATGNMVLAFIGVSRLMACLLFVVPVVRHDGAVPTTRCATRQIQPTLASPGQRTDRGSPLRQDDGARHAGAWLPAHPWPCSLPRICCSRRSMRARFCARRTRYLRSSLYTALSKSTTSPIVAGCARSLGVTYMRRSAMAASLRAGLLLKLRNALL